MVTRMRPHLRYLDGNKGDEIAPDQLARLYQIIAELREQSILARENVVSLREENTRFHCELDEAQRVNDQARQEVWKAIEESRVVEKTLDSEGEVRGRAPSPSS
ncbi:hypothetical protein GLOTRDRAFT_134315 [Gloeophyllum trabeum ATCC 11539]|uniref:Uncharacterized protein n=1 Tax=Gloeophyllum trabeum (strain ATCC 11539 / FP-39264 / Madison 617) TaxID=670483 RepID=S7PQG2_GLOTA|nr:uncharacterized protein GLOTRDRAFT_134315 [Gloeophyllum trabeum ATCC 11539]EPQ50041.1 hypothetical protein GLOTRDRAFT_134315 [Gloeophyllum trabeum ATCC 11539]